MKDIQYMPLQEFLTSGLLQEVNRQFFHPLGLALAVNKRPDGTVNNIVGILDNRDDAEGMVFGDVDGNFIKRAENVINEQRRRAEIRQARLGFVVQPLQQGETATAVGEVSTG